MQLAPFTTYEQNLLQLNTHNYNTISYALITLSIFLCSVSEDDEYDRSLAIAGRFFTRNAQTLHYEL
jgi:hypothetical protein